MAISGGPKEVMWTYLLFGKGCLHTSPIPGYQLVYVSEQRAQLLGSTPHLHETKGFSQRIAAQTTTPHPSNAAMMFAVSPSQTVCVGRDEHKSQK